MHKWKWAIFLLVAPISWIQILDGFFLSLSQTLQLYYRIDGDISDFCGAIVLCSSRLRLRILAALMSVCALHTIDYCSLLSNRGIRFHQFFRSFDYSMKFFNSSICVFVVAGCRCFCCTTNRISFSSTFLFLSVHKPIFFCMRYTHFHFYVAIQPIIEQQKKKKQGKKSERKISHFNIDIAPVGASIIKHEIPM